MRTDDFWAVIAGATADRPASPADVADRPASPADVAGRPASPADVASRPASPADVADRPASPADVADRAVAELATRDPEEIVAWGRHLGKVMTASGTEDLWAAAYLINGGCSDEGFDNFRGWLIAHGRDTVARSVREPDVLAEMPAVRSAATSGAVFEAGEVLTIPARAYEQATGKPLPAEDNPPTRPDASMLWDFDDEEEMTKRLPRLSALFLEPPD